MSEFKVGDKAVGFDGEEIFEGAISRILLSDQIEIKNAQRGITRTFEDVYVYPAGTTIEVKKGTDEATK